MTAAVALPVLLKVSHSGMAPSGTTDLAGQPHPRLVVAAAAFAGVPAYPSPGPGADSSRRPPAWGAPRWVVERSMAWLAGWRRLHRRYERKTDHFLAFTSIACTLICYRRLTK